MGSASKVKRKPAHVGTAGEKALERETRADAVFSPRQKPEAEAKRPSKTGPTHVVRRASGARRTLKTPSPQRSQS